MCGRYSLTQPVEAVRRWFPAKGAPNLAPRYNIAPTQDAPIIRLTGGEPEITMARFGLVPAWAKEIGTKPLINARSETVAEKPSFRAAFKKRRCLIPADGYYEWRSSEGGPKAPFRFRRADGELFAIAGIWETWHDEARGSDLLSFALLTTSPNRRAAEIHDRMPVILMGEDRAAWLETAEADIDRLKPLLRPAPEDYLQAYEVSPRVNAARNEGPDLIRPVTEVANSQMPLL